jgi:hypothetical protein
MCAILWMPTVNAHNFSNFKILHVLDKKFFFPKKVISIQKV